MTADMDDPLGTASPENVLSALRVLLLPKPRLNSLPTVLELLAHMQLVQLRIAEEARRVMMMQDQARRQLETEGVPSSQQVRLGVLSRGEGRKMERWAWHDADTLTEHIAILASHPKAPLHNVKHLLSKVYFPDLSLDSSAPKNYIRYMPDEAIESYERVSQQCWDWVRLVQQAEESQSPRPTMKRMLGSSHSDTILPLLAQTALKEAEQVVKDVADFQAIFEPGDEARSASPYTASLPNVKTTLDMPRARKPLRQKPVGPRDATPKLEHISPHVKSTAKSSILTEEVVGEQTRGPDVRALRHLTFNKDRQGPVRTSIGGQGSTPGPSKPAELSDRNAPVKRSPRDGTTRTSNTPHHQSMTVSRAGGPSPSVRKKPRVSSGLPPESWPDYTQPLPTRKSQSDLRPFDAAELLNHGAAKRPRISEGDSSGMLSAKRRRRRRESFISDASSSDY